MWVRAKVIRKIKGFVTYLDEENQDVFINYPTLEPGRIILLPWHIFEIFYAKGDVEYASENTKKVEEKEEKSKEEYSGLGVMV